MKRGMARNAAAPVARQRAFCLEKVEPLHVVSPEVAKERFAEIKTQLAAGGLHAPPCAGRWRKVEPDGSAMIVTVVGNPPAHFLMDGCRLRFVYFTMHGRRWFGPLDHTEEGK